MLTSVFCCIIQLTKGEWMLGGGGGGGGGGSGGTEGGRLC